MKKKSQKNLKDSDLEINREKSEEGVKSFLVEIKQRLKLL